ncbi:MAG: ATP-grasp domain-containing protein [Candidatus Altiarchaeota archaeon]|nr:ATP-grasp domain-containing protein [Candidatus Altiarchaeota archaeon]
MKGNKKIMILGAGVYQVPAIKAAGSLGYETIVLSREIKKYPGASLADVPLEVDTTDVEGVLSCAREYDVEGVFTSGTDVALPALGRVNDELGLSGPSYEATVFSTNKLLMKEAFLNRSVPTATSWPVDSFSEASAAAEDIGYPLILKPTGTSGSRGVIKVDSKGKLRKAWAYSRRYSRAGEKTLVEEYLTGVEFGSQAFVYDNKIRLICTHNDTVTNPPYLTPIGHSYPFADESIEEEVVSVAKKAIKALGINNSAVNLDLILTDEGVNVFEVGARMGATCLPELTEIYCGVDVTSECIRMSMGEKPYFKNKTGSPCAGLLITSSKKGKITGIDVPDAVRTDKEVIHIDIDVKVNDHIAEFKTGPDRLGSIVVTGDSYLNAEQKAKTFRDMIRIRVV